MEVVGNHNDKTSRGGVTEAWPDNSNPCGAAADEGRREKDKLHEERLVGFEAYAWRKTDTRTGGKWAGAGLMMPSQSTASKQSWGTALRLTTVGFRPSNGVSS